MNGSRYLTEACASAAIAFTTTTTGYYLVVGRRRIHRGYMFRLFSTTTDQRGGTEQGHTTKSAATAPFFFKTPSWQVHSSAAMSQSFNSVRGYCRSLALSSFYDPFPLPPNSPAVLPLHSGVKQRIFTCYFWHHYSLTSFNALYLTGQFPVIVILSNTFSSVWLSILKPMSAFFEDFF